ncbi:hypothetical protein CFP71_08590 [Amycolatopsis thailandensis]|uniref:Uncharacterized protein n=1 Tax=Amycolatopsis thailandensis TaxID=589330 RepID=A0A229SES0_9PSEU|nr:hypothetical protein [Amycolatopsis thailandensis]OXM57320.1 hypothetical protein CFP71_08590 [Amycolatopsis thailandensis]
MSYAEKDFRAQLDIISGEVLHTLPRLKAAKEMWTKGREWISSTQDLVRRNLPDLSRGWLDAPGRRFVERVDASSGLTLGSWLGSESFGPPGTAPGLTVLVSSMVDQPIRGGIVESQVLARIGALETLIESCARFAGDQIRRVEADQDQLKAAQHDLGVKLDEMAAQYRPTAMAMYAARGRAWDGPTGEVPSGNGTPFPANGTGAGGPNQNDVPDVPDPGTPEEPAPQNPQNTPSALEQATDALSALSQAAESAQQLLGNGSGLNLPDTNPVDPGDWTLPPYDGASYPGLGDPLAASGGAGMPSLAGGGLPEAGGGAGGLGGLPAVPGANGSPGAAMNGLGSLPGIAPAGTSGSAGSASGAGGMPPMMPPGNGGGKNSSGGIKPGDADHAGSGRQRGPRSGATPGVALLGRSKGGGARQATAQRRWDAENDTVQLLDDELWQVNEQTTDSHGKTAKKRAGH